MTRNATALFTAGAALFGALACATTGPSPALMSAREAYQTAEKGPAKELSPADLHEARTLLDQAEAAGANDGADAARHRAYLAQRRAELADVQGKTAAAVREKEQTERQMQALKEQALVKAKGQLAEASANQTQTEADLAQAQRQLAAEHKSRVVMHGELAAAAATQKETEKELTQAHGQLDAEHQARLTAEQETDDALRKIAAVKKEARGMVITLSGSVVFASGKSDLLATTGQRLDRVAEALRANDRSVLIEGHTDSSGPAAFNRDLSQSRAQAVLEYLTSHGVQRGRLRGVGMGSERPIAENTTAEGRASNRRVEIVIEDSHRAVD